MKGSAREESAGSSTELSPEAGCGVRAVRHETCAAEARAERCGWAVTDTYMDMYMYNMHTYMYMYMHMYGSSCK